MKGENGERQRQKWGRGEGGGETLNWKLMMKRAEKREKRKSRKMRVAAEKKMEERKSEIRWGRGGRLRYGVRGDAISRPYLLIMSLYFKVQSVPVMLLHDCASGEFPYRSDDKRMHGSRVCGAHTMCDTLWAKLWHNLLRSLILS